MKDKEKVLVFDLDDTLFDSTNQPPDNGKKWGIKLFSGFRKILESRKNINILVTRGEKERQNRKIDVLQIRRYFNIIHIVDLDSDKFNKFSEIKNDYNSHEIIIIGNRIDCEIRYGNQLGLKTIHIEHGKYSTVRAKDDFEVPSIKIGVADIVNLNWI